MFKITYSWKRRIAPHPFSEDDIVDASALFLALRRFLAGWEGKFALQFDRLQLDFDLDPDLSTVFEEVPSVLASLTHDSERAAELDFFEQGTDLALVLARRGADVFVTLRKGVSVGRRFAHLPAGALAVPASAFLEQWARFTRAILDALVAEQPELLNEQSYRDYVSRLPRLD